MKRLILGYLLFGVLLVLAMVLVLHAETAPKKAKNQVQGTQTVSQNPPADTGRVETTTKQETPQDTLTVSQHLLQIEQRLTGLEKRMPSVATLLLGIVLAGLVGGLAASGFDRLKQRRSKPDANVRALARIEEELEYLGDRMEHLRRILTQIQPPSLAPLHQELTDLKQRVEHLVQQQEQWQGAWREILQELQGMTGMLQNLRQEIQRQGQNLQVLFQQRHPEPSAPPSPSASRTPSRPQSSKPGFIGYAGTGVRAQEPVDLPQKIKEIQENWSRWTDEQKRKAVEEMKRYGYDVRDPLLEGKKHNYYGVKFKHNRKPDAKEIRVICPLIEKDGKVIVQGIKEGP